MRIIDHRLEGAPFRAAALTGGPIVPEIVVLHDTAGRLAPGNAVEWLATTPKASVHFVVERDGSVTQLVPTNRRAGHAGQSTWQGRRDCNAFSIGIEIVNPGRLTRGGGGAAFAWFGQEFGYGEWKLVEMTTPQHGPGLWMPYAEDQIDAVLALLTALFDAIPTLEDITTHWYVSPGRKIDTNPLFPLESLRARVLGRDDPAEAKAERLSRDAGAGAYVRIAAPGSTLNLRLWPSFNPNVIAQIPNGTEVPVLRTGLFGGQGWHKVLFDGREGWVVARYAKPA